MSASTETAGETLLAQKRIVITGVATTDSIAFGVASIAQRCGAEVVLTSFGRVRALTERAASRLPEPVEVLELDAARPDDFPRLAEDLSSRWPRIDGVVHAIAFAPPDALGGNFLHTSMESATRAFALSAFSLKALAEALAPLMSHEGGDASIVGLDFDASVAWPGYDWMGVSKAALESVVRYLARDLGPLGIRANLVAAGPLRTPASSGVPGFDEIAAAWCSDAPLGWDPSDTEPAARTACLLLSDWSQGITGEVVHVDGGFHAVGLGGGGGHVPGAAR